MYGYWSSNDCGNMQGDVARFNGAEAFRVVAAVVRCGVIHVHLRRVVGVVVLRILIVQYRISMHAHFPSSPFLAKVGSCARVPYPRGPFVVRLRLCRPGGFAITAMMYSFYIFFTCGMVGDTK